MTRAYQVALLLSAAAFLAYGIACLAFDGMKRDFERFGMGHLRVLTGTLEVLGALGLLVGYARWPALVAASAAGLALLMGAGVATRVRVLDSLAQTLPALVLLLLNAAVAWYALASSR
ncbi:hypothetical protein TBR22_A43480 [Luteitalea sp. TBR-22]|uniref:DoxX family protein n=1 Tax=Luteitalea sp. TBR-22 TaxID=2802971 RepID=UPI001AF699AC|nr:DoxX family protein [Luteitalea sp. TBR-22]BCS35122.1 hypothetical protein TBR22_A43480 [Luteitalea sp. TBR-22]